MLSSKMLRLLVATVMAASLPIAYATPASAASGGNCSLNGSANLNPGLGATSQPFTYTFTGGLSGCQSSDSTAPATGTSPPRPANGTSPG